MLKKLTITNTGPTDAELEFGNRLNLITGDNGLGKSFLLDIAWWAMTRKWPAEVNPRLTAGKVALPTDKKQKAAIGFSFTGVSKTKEAVIYFEPRLQNWNIPRGRPANPGIVFYAMADGSFAVLRFDGSCHKEHNAKQINHFLHSIMILKLLQN